MQKTSSYGLVFFVEPSGLGRPMLKSD